MVNREPSSSWRVVDHSCETVFHNLALEEAMARSIGSPNFVPTVRFWVNTPSVVLGRFQDSSFEVDTSLCEQKNIPIARRFTGGGTVYHDAGNLNFTIIDRADGRLGLTKIHETAHSILEKTILRLGVQTTSISSNSILVGGRKIAGAAAAVGRGFALWHCSILVSTDTDLLRQLLAPGTISFRTRYVRSRWHPVTTLRQVTGRTITIGDVKDELIASAEKILRVELEEQPIRNDEMQLSANLYADKYSTENWNRYGRFEK